jgi:nicotinate-nucleotide adenylyltransferase
MKRILLFGGTFDPIHYGHVGLLHIVKRQLLIDEVDLIPTKQPPWKVDMAPIKHRLAMINLALEDAAYKICTYEIEQPDIAYTIDTVRYFKHQFPDDELYYLIGSDHASVFHEWKQADELAKLAKFIVYRRPGYPLSRQSIERFHFLIMEGKRFEVSSTRIRALQSLDMPFVIIEYIIKHNLYFSKKLQSFYDKKRFLHVMSVAKLAHDIALSNQLDASKATIAALLHDIAKNLDQNISQKMIMAADPSLVSAPLFSIHQFAGALLATQEFGIVDEEILDAIRYHASAKPQMNPLGKVLYAADKIEPLRGFDSKPLIASCLKDYHQGFIDVLQANYEFHQEKGKPFKYDITAEAIKYYLEDKHED